MARCAKKEKEAAVKKKKTVFDFAAAVVVIAAVLLVSMSIIPKGHCDEGVSLRIVGNRDGAVTAWAEGKSNVDSLSERDDNLAEAAARDAKITKYKTVGNIVTFGKYEQDNDTGNGDEDIEWMILDVQGNKAYF